MDGEKKVVLIGIISVLSVTTVGILGAGFWVKNRISENEQEEITVGEKIEELKAEEIEKSQSQNTESPEVTTALLETPLPSAALSPSLTPTVPVYPAVSNGSVKAVGATSSLSEYNMTHSPEFAKDESLSTAWVEGVSGNGEGEFLMFTFDNMYQVSGFDICAGYQKNEDIYSKNARPKEIELEFSNGTKHKITLGDVNEMQTFQLPEPVNATSVSVKILSVYSGWKYTDTAISEISFY